MGDKYTYKCTKCNYSVLTSGKLDRGMFAVVEPYICNDCKELTDVLVGEVGIKIELEFLSAKEKRKFYRCSECNSKNITLWDTKKKHCPKCDARMKIDREAPIMCWD